MRKTTGLAIFFLTTALAAPMSLAQDAASADAGGGGGSLSCSLLVDLEAADARVFMQGYLAGRRDASGSGSPQEGMTQDGGETASAATAEVEAGADGAASPQGSPEEPSVSPNLEEQADATDDPDDGTEEQDASGAGGAEGPAFSLASLDAMVDAAVAACQGSPDRQLFEVAAEADPRDPMNTEPGLAGEGAPQPD